MTTTSRVAHHDRHGRDVAARFAIRAAVAAPSVHNTQPWLFVARDEAIGLFADPQRGLPSTDPLGRESTLSCGAALFNLRVAMRHLGFTPEVRLLPDPRRPELLAYVGWGQHVPPAWGEDMLFRAVTRRHTHRGPFFQTSVPPHLLAGLHRCVRVEGADLRMVRDEAHLGLLAELTHAAQDRQADDPLVAAELARWTPPPRSHRRDGVPARAYPRIPDGVEFATRDFAADQPWGFRVQPRRSGSGGLGTVAIVTTEADGRRDWLVAGQALQRMLLQATSHGLSAAFHNQPLEIPELRHRIEYRITSGGCPQMLLRLGYATRMRETPRRPVSDVLVDRRPAASVA